MGWLERDHRAELDFTGSIEA
jgi:hypothetical protein